MLKYIITFLCVIFCQTVEAQNEFITIWKPGKPHTMAYAGISVNSNNNQIWFPGRGTDYQIYWEEIGYPSHNATLSNVSSNYQILIDFGSPSNPVPAEATYRVKVSNGNGNFHQIRFSDWDMFSFDGIVGDVHKILKVEQWGNISWSSMEQAFHMCKFLDVTATDIPDLSDVTDMSFMFAGCYSFVGNPTIDAWDISSVTTLLDTFSGCYLFNQPVGSWNTSNVTIMATTFLMAQVFNQPLANWNTSKVESMTAMFNNAREFNQPIGNWDTSKNLDFEFMFSNAHKFNQPIGNWDTSKAIEMDRMFSNAKAFNQDISTWNTGNVTIMEGMFANALAFNQNIGNWDVSNVESMSDMFNGAQNFNADLSNWDVSSVQYMHNMFRNTQNFNQNIGSWNVNNVKNMSNMFTDAVKFNQNLGEWQLASLMYANGMFLNSGLNCQNYDSTLLGWSISPSTPNNINLVSASPLTYSHPAAVNARSQLITTKNWTIAGDTYDGECQSFLGTSDVKTKNAISIYPNPATDFIYVENSGGAYFMIIDMSGRIIEKGTISAGKINIQRLESGNYILKLLVKDESKNFKFIKQ